MTDSAFFIFAFLAFFLAEVNSVTPRRSAFLALAFLAFFLAEVNSVMPRSAFLAFDFLAFFLAEVNSVMPRSAFLAFDFLAFFFAADSSSPLTMSLPVAATAGVRLVKPSRPRAAIMVESVFMLFPRSILVGTSAVRASGGRLQQAFRGARPLTDPRGYSNGPLWAMMNRQKTFIFPWLNVRSGCH